ncbi:TetR/AcrR family transcriptional regulator [Methylobacterium iners]|uniref:HTH-type transcriptional repressor BdcR n=1 Tax=Methylobacterium iners TaxID=418707 RepID=A0ABQ4S313_9HYPH|nr:TetR/AcrR family transcriptional regulator [Methylobacterium iners]GJD96838.1 HTH-type transcriptional repressor BdcR [Methylobacterium iners]
MAPGQDQIVATAKEKSRRRGRPRSFDVGAAVETAKALFQERGYAGVGMADLSRALDLAPPSIYAAFGSKAGLFARVVDRYSATNGAFFDAALAEPDLGDGIAALLGGAARTYAGCGQGAGCLILNGVQACDEPAAREAVAAVRARARARVVAYLADLGPARAERLADLVGVALAGLSAAARDGMGAPALDDFATVAARALRFEVDRRDVASPGE